MYTTVKCKDVILLFTCELPLTIQDHFSLRRDCKIFLWNKMIKSFPIEGFKLEIRLHYICEFIFKTVFLFLLFAYIEVISWVDLCMIFIHEWGCNICHEWAQQTSGRYHIRNHFYFMTNFLKENTSGNYFVLKCT